MLCFFLNKKQVKKNNIYISSYTPLPPATLLDYTVH